MPLQRQYATNGERQAAYRARKTGTVTPTVTPAPAKTVQVGTTVYKLPLDLRSISRIASAASTTEEEITRLSKWEAAGCCGAPDRPWNPTMDEMLRQYKGQVTKAKNAIAEALGNVTVTDAPTAIEEDQIVTFKVWTTGKDDKEVEVPMCFKVKGLPSDGDFWRNRLPECRGKRFAHIALEVIEEPKAKPVTKPTVTPAPKRTKKAEKDVRETAHFKIVSSGRGFGRRYDIISKTNEPLVQQSFTSYGYKGGTLDDALADLQSKENDLRHELESAKEDIELGHRCDHGEYYHNADGEFQEAEPHSLNPECNECCPIREGVAAVTPAPVTEPTLYSETCLTCGNYRIAEPENSVSGIVTIPAAVGAWNAARLHCLKCGTKASVYNKKKFADRPIGSVKPVPVTAASAKKAKPVDPQKELLKRFRIAKRAAKYYVGMMGELLAVNNKYAELLELWSGKDGYPWTPPTPDNRLPKTEKEFQAEYDKATSDFNIVLAEGEATGVLTTEPKEKEPVTVANPNPAQFDEHGNCIPPTKKEGATA